MKKAIISALVLTFAFGLFGCSAATGSTASDDRSTAPAEGSTASVTEAVTAASAEGNTASATEAAAAGITEGNTASVTEAATAEPTYQEVLEKALAYLGKYISLEKYEIDKTSNGDSVISITGHGMDEANISFTATIEGKVPVTVKSTQMGDLLAYGCTKGDQEKAYQDGDVYMLYNEKYFHVWVNRRNANETISNMDLQTDENAVDFEYCGLNARSSVEDVVGRLGNPNLSISIKYLESSDKYTIGIMYSGYNSAYDEVFASFNFEYDYKTDTTKMIDLFLFS